VDDCLAATGAGRSNGWLRHAAGRALAAGARHARHAAGDRRRGRHAAPAWCCARAPRPTWATACADLPGWLAAGVPLSLGSDSQVTRNWPEELRWLEYGQRL
jgi:formimidoylglutamate deiminase